MFKNKFVVQVKNYTIDFAAEAYRVIKTEIKKVYTNPDPGISFKKKILEFLKVPNGRSRLGLAKIRLETGAKLSVKCESTGLIIVTASFLNHK